jgi:tetratricopeptide (TPR) repeat protein
MCGGDLEIIEGASVAECEFCGTKQTVPKANDENLQNLYNRANTLRIKSEFDKAEKLYEKIIQADSTQAEAYWGLILCKYGIEYVDDPTTFKKIPTCHRASYDSIVADDDYKSALTNADSSQKAIYEAQAKEIDRIQKDILSLAQKEETYDVFICYKETDANGQRTQDSVIANDIYYQLKQEGFKVFYAAITLEGKLGREYEPIIFAALNSAKVMLSIGTKPEYFNAVWVKNEWSRFLKIIKKDRSKLLIPCYKNMDAYELPEEFAHLQAQDMGKIGFINDVVRGIKKVIKKDEPKTTVVKETVVNAAPAANIAPLLKRAFMFMEDGDWSSAEEYCEKVLDLDPECAQAYLGKLMAELKVRKQDDLKDCAQPFDSKNNYQKAIRFADEKLKTTLAGYIEHINVRNATARLEGIYNGAVDKMKLVNTESAFKEIEEIFRTISSYRDAAILADQCAEHAENAHVKAETARKNEIYDRAKRLMQSDDEKTIEQAIPLFASIAGWLDADSLKARCAELAGNARKEHIYHSAKGLMNKPAGVIDKFSTAHYEEAINKFQTIYGWKDADQQVEICKQKIEELKVQEEADHVERERQKANAQAEAQKKAKRNKMIVIITTSIVCAIIAFVIVLNTVIIPNVKYNDAMALMNAGKNFEAALAFDAISNYRDAKMQCFAAWNKIAVRDTISAGYAHTVGLKADGTVVATMYAGDYYKGQCKVSGWKDIIAIAAGEYHTIGLKADGTVVAVGDNDYGQCDVSDWADIVAIAAGEYHTIGLKADGTVVATTYTGNYYDGQCDVSEWTDIIAIAAGDCHTVGLKADGTVVAVGENKYGECSVSRWKDIVTIATASCHTVGLKADGTVVAVGLNNDDRCNVSNWKDIVAIAAGEYHTIGLKADGTVVALGRNWQNQCDVTGWKDIVAIAAKKYHTIGLKADGTVVAVGDNDYGQCNVSSWKNIKVPEKR